MLPGNNRRKRKTPDNDKIIRGFACSNNGGEIGTFRIILRSPPKPADADSLYYFATNSATKRCKALPPEADDSTTIFQVFARAR
jgi:hypothetical protein